MYGVSFSLWSKVAPSSASKNVKLTNTCLILTSMTQSQQIKKKRNF